MRKVLKLIPLRVAIVLLVQGSTAIAIPQEAPDLVQRALAAEMREVQDSSRPMRYQLRKRSPRLTTTKEMIETREGSVAMLVAVNDQPLSVDDEKKEQLRLNQLLADPGKQRHRKQAQDQDTARALKVLRVLPAAFVYRDAGSVAAGSGYAEKFIFSPNPNFDPPDLETQVLTAMNGEIWIDPAQARVVRLEARLQQDVDFGWGVLGRLYRGGWITIDQAEVGGGNWRIVRFQMSMSARVLFRTRTFETTEEETHYSPVPVNLGYREAIALLRSGAAAEEPVRGR